MLDRRGTAFDQTRRMSSSLSLRARDLGTAGWHVPEPRRWAWSAASSITSRSTLPRPSLRSFLASLRACHPAEENLSVPGNEIASRTILNDLRADSLDVVELVMEFEEEFGVTIPDDDYERIRTVGDVIRYIEERQRGG